MTGECHERFYYGAAFERSYSLLNRQGHVYAFPVCGRGAADWNEALLANVGVGWFDQKLMRNLDDNRYNSPTARENGSSKQRITQAPVEATQRVRQLGKLSSFTSADRCTESLFVSTTAETNAEISFTHQKSER